MNRKTLFLTLALLILAGYASAPAGEEEGESVQTASSDPLSNRVMKSTTTVTENGVEIESRVTKYSWKETEMTETEVCVLDGKELWSKKSEYRLHAGETWLLETSVRTQTYDYGLDVSSRSYTYDNDGRKVEVHFKRSNPQMAGDGQFSQIRKIEYDAEGRQTRESNAFDGGQNAHVMEFQYIKEGEFDRCEVSAGGVLSHVVWTRKAEPAPGLKERVVELRRQFYQQGNINYEMKINWTFDALGREAMNASSGNGKNSPTWTEKVVFTYDDTGRLSRREETKESETSGVTTLRVTKTVYDYTPPE